jgi:hypothetical protein
VHQTMLPMTTVPSPYSSAIKPVKSYFVHTGQEELFWWAWSFCDANSWRSENEVLSQVAKTSSNLLLQKSRIFYRTGPARCLQSPTISGDEVDGAPVWPHLLGSHTSCKVPDCTHVRICNRRYRDQVDPKYRISQHWYGG